MTNNNTAAFTMSEMQDIADALAVAMDDIRESLRVAKYEQEIMKSEAVIERCRKIWLMVWKRIQSDDPNEQTNGCTIKHRDHKHALPPLTGSAHYAIVLRPGKIPIEKRLPEDAVNQVTMLEELRRIYPDGLIAAVDACGGEIATWSPEDVKAFIRAYTRNTKS